MDYIGPYLLDSLRATVGAIEIWTAQDAVTGVPALVYKPVIAELPRWRIEGVLPWTSRVADAWVAELPFGAAPLSEREGNASAAELTAWSRRLLATLLEMKALDLRHGRISAEHLWVKGDEIWLEGLGLPLPAEDPDEPALVKTLRQAAGDSWQGWPFHRIMERLADGELSLREAAERLAEPMSLDELDALAGGKENESSSLEPPPTGTVRVLGRGEARPRPADEKQAEEGAKAGVEPPAGGEETPLPVEPPRPYQLGPEPTAEEVRVVRRGKKKEGSPAREEPKTPLDDKKLAKEASQPKLIEEPVDNGAKAATQPAETEPPARVTSERPVVRIDEVSEPAFEVIEPSGASSGRGLYRFLFVGLTVLLLIFAVVWYGRGNRSASSHAQGYAIEFRLEPQGEHAELVLLEAPEESQLVSNRVLAVIPGKVYFDVPGVYRIQLRADGYLPQEKLLTIPPSSRVITVRLSHQGR